MELYCYDLNTCNNELRIIKDKLRLKRQIKLKLTSIEEDIENQRLRKEALETQLAEEEKHLNNLASNGITSIFYKIIGNNNSNLVETQNKFESFKLSVDECTNRLSTLRVDAYTTEKELEAFNFVDAEYERALINKERIVINSNNKYSNFLSKLNNSLHQFEAERDKLQHIYSMGKELLLTIEYLIDASMDAESSAASDCLDSDYGHSDKYSKIESANDLAIYVCHLLKKFNDELITTDITYVYISISDLYTSTGSGATSDSFFFNEHNSDHRVHELTSYSVENAFSAKDKVHSTLCKMVFKIDDLKEKIIELNLKKREILENI